MVKEQSPSLNYATIPGYSNIFPHRDDIRGRGVGVYLKDAIDFKTRTDIENIEPELEHIWLEIPRCNKHSVSCYSVLCITQNVCRTLKLGWTRLKIYLVN